MNPADYHILIVDDDPDIREALTMILEDEGYVVANAANGQAALNWLKTTEHRPNLILLDLMMPIMNGWEFSAALQREDGLSTIPLIVLSADSNMATKARSIKAATYLAKPVDLSTLLATVSQHCR